MSDDLTLEETFDFFTDRIESEEEEFDGDVPNHAETILVSEATGVMEVVQQYKMATKISDDPDEMDDATRQTDIEGSVVDLLMAILTLQHEEGLDIEGAIEDRMELIRDYEQYEAAMDNAETHQEEMEALDEHFSDELAEEMNAHTAPTVGENVDREDYESDRDRGIQ